MHNYTPTIFGLARIRMVSISRGLSAIHLAFVKQPNALPIYPAYRTLETMGLSMFALYHRCRLRFETMSEITNLGSKSFSNVKVIQKRAPGVIPNGMIIRNYARRRIGYLHIANTSVMTKRCITLVGNGEQWKRDRH